MGVPAEPQQFQNLFESPTVQAMHSLTPKEFEQFVAYVFSRAGYIVHDVALKFTRGVDLELFADSTSGKRMGGVEVKRYEPETLVNSETVQKLMGAPIVKRSGSAYLVTTSGFNKAAYDMAAHGGHTYLIDGEQLCRYIRYVRGSRFENTAAAKVIIPPDYFAGVQRNSGNIRYHTKVLAIANNKGGVGKTTTARYFATGLAARGQQVVVVDMDAQGNLTEKFLDVSSSAITHPHLAGYFAGQYALGQLPRATSCANIELIPAHPHLSLVDTGGSGRPDIELRFRRDLLQTFGVPSAARPKPADWIILDTPPAISMYTRAALAAADYVLAPARARPSSLAGIINMLGMMETMGALVGTTPQLLGCLITHWEEDATSRNTFTRLQEMFDNRGSRILKTTIPTDVTIEKTSGPTRHRAREAYEEAIEEVLGYVNNR